MKTPALPRPRPWWFVVALGLYAGLVTFLFFTHLPWRDEGQAWLWAKELSRPQDFLIVPGEGHPPLWFWLLKLLSLAFPFEVARYFAFALTLINGLLLGELLKDRFWVFAAYLFSVFVAFFWGVMFRPYTLIVTLTLIGLILTRRDRTTAAGWVLAAGVGLHFYASFIFGLWLLIRLTRRPPLPPLVGPAILAGLFALSAILSGRGNPDGDLDFGNLPLGPISDFVGGFGVSVGYALSPILAAAIVGLLVLEFRQNRTVLWCFLAVGLAFSLFTHMIYGIASWHLALMPILMLSAFALAETPIKGWRLAILVLPWVWMTREVIDHAINIPYSGAWAAHDSLASAAEAEGIALGPDTLVVWPDHIFAAPAARHDLRVTSGNLGTEIGPTNWAARPDSDIAVAAFVRPHPYFLVCAECEKLTGVILDNGLVADLVMAPILALDERLAVYRITPE
ncbi:MAG: hypothetical protein WD674_00640 [Cucumibacter sp.]